MNLKTKKGLYMQHLIIYIFILFPLKLFSYESQTWTYKDWQTDLFANERVVFKTAGYADGRSEFGFVLNKNKCNENNIWLTLPTSIYEEKSNIKHVDLDFVIDKKTYNIKLSVAKTIGPVLLFTNTILPESFIKLLKEGKTLKIKGKRLSNISLYEEWFSLNGFAANLLKAKAACKDSSVLSKPPQHKKSLFKVMCKSNYNASISRRVYGGISDTEFGYENNKSFLYLKHEQMYYHY